MRYLAIDYGTKRAGLAICDRDETICSPLTVLPVRRDLLDRLHTIIDDEHVEALVVGLPLNMDGTQGPQAELVRRFSQQLAEHTGLPVHLQDERLSSFAAEQKLAASSQNKAGRRKPTDAVAAAEILDAFLQTRHTP